MNTRVIICRILESFDKRPGDLEPLIEKELTLSPVDHRDRRFIFEIVLGVIRRRLTLDYVIERLINDHKLRTCKPLIRILEIGVYQLIYMDRVPDHAAVNETVNCAKFDKRTEQFSGIINGVLRTVIKGKKRIEYPDARENIAYRIAVEYSHPQWMVQRWLSRIGLSRTKQLCAFNNEKPEIYLRRKMHGVSRRQFEMELRDRIALPCGYGNLYYRLTKPTIPGTVELFEEGLCTVQAPSSGWIVALLEVQKNDDVLDVCSAPGGKSSLIAEITAAPGGVFACEIKHSRMALVRDTLQRMKLDNVALVQCDGRFLPFSRRFHKIVLDAPCSGSGVLHRHPEARWTKTLNDIDRLSMRQAQLLEASSEILSPGGILVYATCSLEPEENELQIDRFLKTHPEFILEPPPSAVPAYYIDSAGFVRITPYDHKLDGIFGARLKKIREKEQS